MTPPDKCPACWYDGVVQLDCGIPVPVTVFDSRSRCRSCKAIWWEYELRQARESITELEAEKDGVAETADVFMLGFLSYHWAGIRILRGGRVVNGNEAILTAAKLCKEDR